MIGAQLFDQFYGSNGTALAAHTPDVGGPWVDDTPGLQIQGNTLEQSVDSPKSHTEFSGRILTLQVLVDLNVCDDGNFVRMTLGDDAGTNKVQTTLYGDGTADWFLVAAGSSGTNVNEYNSPPKIDKTKSHVFTVAIGPSFVQYLVDGLPWGKFLREILTSVPITRLTLEMSGLNAKPSPKVKMVYAG